MKEFFAFLSIALAFIAYIPYIRDTFAGKTTPHIFSWFTWSLVSFIAFGLQFTNDGGAGSFTNFAMGIICLIIALRGLKNGVKELSKTDFIALVLALVSIILWIVIKQPLLSIILLVCIDLFSFIPTITKSWAKPWQETLFTWELSIIRNSLTIFSLASINLITVAHPAYSILSNLLFCAMLIFRRQVVIR